MPSWDPGQYARFGDHRSRPGLELIARLPPIAAKTIVDLGCGTGELTRALADRFPGASVTGIDSSADMLAKARAIEGIDWREGDIATWTPPAPVDLIFTNAALQWLPEHETLFPRLVSQLAPGGVFACQMPNNFTEPSHRLMRAVASAEPFAAKLAGTRGLAPVARPDSYVDWLTPLARDVDMWETRYWHVLDGEDPVVEWVKGTGMRPFLDRLAADDRAGFLDAYAHAIRDHYPRRPDGRTLYPFPRLFIVAVKA
jgi:trans-aconitate 2-methyltransferase